MTDFATIDDTAAEGNLAATRAQFRDILRPEDDDASGGSFPRSRTMRALTGGGAAAALALALVAAAIIVTRPGVAGRLARATPVINLPRQFGFGLR